MDTLIFLNPLRSAFIISQLLAIAVLIVRLWLDHIPFVAIAIVMSIPINGFVLCLTWHWLRKQSHNKNTHEVRNKMSLSNANSNSDEEQTDRER
jgi:ABC-type transport system involved in cytochrome bd biosynthesis fused ATPase/permease subunit